MRYPLVYEIPVRAWLHGLTRDQGRVLTLREIPAEVFEQWAGQGMTHVWLMGVWSTGVGARQHALRLAQAGKLFPHAVSNFPDEVCGSPYAIAGYRVDPALGGEEGLAVFRKELNAHGLGLILDFIPNHLALDHAWVQEHPDWFVGSSKVFPEAFRSGAGARTRWIAHGKDPFFPAWSDTAQLDWRLQSVHSAMLSEWLNVAERCDGVRVDMAMLILKEVFERQWERLPLSGTPVETDFWKTAIPLIKSRYPTFLCMAEAYWDLEPKLLEQGFDYAYDKRFYDHVIGRRPSELRRHLAGGVGNLWQRGVRFLENHDEVRIASLTSKAEHRAWAAMLLGMPGGRLLHQGQLEGRRHRADIRTFGPIAEPVDEEVAHTYRSLLARSQVLGDWIGEAELLNPEPACHGNPSHDGFVAWTGLRGKGRPFLGIANLAPLPAQCRIQMPSRAGASPASWVDLLSGGRFSSRPVGAGRSDMILDLPSHQCVWLQPEIEA